MAESLQKVMIFRRCGEAVYFTVVRPVLTKYGFNMPGPSVVSFIM